MASISKRPNGKWRARYRDPDGQEHARHFQRKADAQRWLDEVTADLVTGSYVDPAAGRRRFEPYARAWLAAQTFDVSSRETVTKRLTNHLTPAFGSMQLREIRTSTVRAWLGGQAARLAPRTVEGHLTILSAILDAAVEDRLIASNPCRASSVKLPKPPRGRIVPWSTELVGRIIEAHSERYRGLPIVGAGLGLRQGEAFGLALDDIDFLRRVVHIRRQIRTVDNLPVFAPPKGNKTRDIPLSDWVAMQLSAFYKEYSARSVTLPWRDQDGRPVTARLLFTSSRGAVRRPTYNQSYWHPAISAVGIEPSRATGFHQLRHHYASILLDGGVSIRQLADHLGHTDPGYTLRVYTHLIPDSEDRTRRAIDSAFQNLGADHLRTEESEEG